jgi:hypothetical protein
VLTAVSSAACRSSSSPPGAPGLLAHPEATIQDGRLVLRVRARELSGAEKQAWWDLADVLNPNYARYRATGNRDIPIVALEPAA